MNKEKTPYLIENKERDTFGVTEESHQLLEVNAKEIMNDRYYLQNGSDSK